MLIQVEFKATRLHSLNTSVTAADGFENTDCWFYCEWNGFYCEWNGFHKCTTLSTNSFNSSDCTKLQHIINWNVPWSLWNKCYTMFIQKPKWELKHGCFIKGIYHNIFYLFGPQLRVDIALYDAHVQDELSLHWLSTASIFSWISATLLAHFFCISSLSSSTTAV